MSPDDGYDREWTDHVEVGMTLIRYGLTVERGIPVEFLVQLEYLVPGERDSNEWNPGDWRVVARFDHDASGPEYRDVGRVGLHLDVLKPDGTQLPKRRDFPVVPIEQAMRYADDYLRDHHEFLIRRFRTWL